LALSRADSYRFPIDDFSLALFDYEMIDVLDENLFDPIVDSLVVQAADGITTRLVVVCDIMSVATAVLALTVLIAQVIDLLRIRAAFRFVLACLSMVDSRHVLQNPAVLAVFSENFRSVAAGNDALAPAFERAQDESEQCIILLDRDDTIVWFNKRACEVFRFRDQIASRMPLNRVLRFETRPTDKLVDMNVTLENFGLVFHMRVSRVELEKKEHSALFLFDLTAVDAKSRHIAETEERIEHLRRSIMPPGITESQMDVRDCVVVVIELHDLTRYIARHQAGEASARLEKFVSILDRGIATSEKATRIRRLGSAVWIVFNLAPHSLQPLSKTALDALTFCRNVGEVLHDEVIEFRIGIALEPEARAGVVSKDRLLFDFYGQAMVTAHTLARRAAPGTALMVPDIAQFERSRSLTVTQLALVDVREEFYEMRID
jgi:class 3 adenylate cyclase